MPLGGGVFSAVGLLFSDLELNELAPYLRLLDDASLDEAHAIYADLKARIVLTLGVAEQAVTFQPLADGRFKGQAFELTVPVDPAILSTSGRGAVFTRFDQAFRAEHVARYGHDFGGAFPMEIVNLRLVGTVASAVQAPASAGHIPRSASSVRRAVYFGPAHGQVDTPVTGRGALDGSRRPGPLIVEEYEGTVVVPPDCAARLDPGGNIVVTLPSAPGI